MAVRLMEIDALRGMATLGMVLFHAAFDWMILGMWDFEPYGWPLIIAVRAVQFLFLGLAGVSVALSSRRMGGQLKRGGRIFACGMLVSVATWLVFPGEFVKFGVLHFIGVAVPLVTLLKGRRAAALMVAVGSFLVGRYLGGITVESEWLFWLGLKSAGFSSLDYFPIFPWIAVVLVGLVMGETVYGGRGTRSYPLGHLRASPSGPTRLAALAKVPGLTAMGRHSLAIYLLHQPVLYFTLWGLSEALT